SIAMAQGSEAAKNIANLVLLDSDFSHLPQIVNEGRRVINNIQRTASLFLVKTTFSVILSLLTLFFIPVYPFEPIQLTLISTVSIGMPSFFLALEPNHERVQGNFLVNVFRNALPGALCVVLMIFMSMRSRRSNR
ncbi:MAG: cation-translocating P-type ATPase, partial [Merdibacter sp.]